MMLSEKMMVPLECSRTQVHTISLLISQKIVGKLKERLSSMVYFHLRLEKRKQKLMRPSRSLEFSLFHQILGVGQ